MENPKECKYCLILSTAPDLATARKLAQTLVERRLAACVNLVPGLESIYHWQGVIESSSEVMLVIKTELAKQEQSLAALSELHPYDTPEGIVVALGGGLQKYLDWIGSSLREDCDSLDKVHEANQH